MCFSPEGLAVLDKHVVVNDLASHGVSDRDDFTLGLGARLRDVGNMSGSLRAWLSRAVTWDVSLSGRALGSSAVTRDVSLSGLALGSRAVARDVRLSLNAWLSGAITWDVSLSRWALVSLGDVKNKFLSLRGSPWDNITH